MTMSIARFMLASVMALAAAAMPLRAQSAPPAAPNSSASKTLPPPPSGAVLPDSMKPKPAAVPTAPPPTVLPAPPKPAARTAVTAEGVDNEKFARPASLPANATGRCKDGTWLFGAVTDANCASNGGTAFLVPVPMTPPPAPRRP